MSTPKDQHVINVPFGPGRNKTQGNIPAATHTQTDKPRIAAPMQALAAELQQAAVQGVFEYPSVWTMVARVISVLFIALSAFNIAMVTIPSVQAAGSFGGGLLSLRVTGALIGFVVACAVASIISNLFQAIQVTPQGLSVNEITGKRRIPWKQIGVLRVMEMPSKGRYMVMIPIEGPLKSSTPAPMLTILPLLVGASKTGERGVIVTSNIKNFERLLQLIVSYMAQEAGQVIPAVEAFVDENTVMPVGQLLLEPSAAITRMAQSPEELLDVYGMATNEDDAPVSWQALLTKQAWIALIPAVLVLADMLLRNGEKPFSLVGGIWVLAIFALGLAELPFIAKLVQAVGELVVGGGHFKRTLWAYLELQVPRVIIIAFGAGLLGLGVPAVVAQVLWAVGILVTTTLLTRLTMKMYHITLAQTAMASIGAFLFQAALLAFYFGVR